VSDSALVQVFIYLAAAVVGVPVAKQLGLGSVLGYLLAGIAIGPHALGLVGGEGSTVMHVAEFGVVMMLFLVGLELEPKLLWKLRRTVLGLGSAQVLVTAALALAALTALGIPWNTAVAIGLTLAMSSTAIVLQSLNERSLLQTPGGQGAFSILLFQDIAVIPILAAFPLLASTGGHPIADAATSATQSAAGHAPRPGWLQALLVIGAVAAVVATGRYVVRPLFRWLAKVRLREVFIAAALAIVVGIAALMTLADLSPALGTFLAGVVLAESEYRHELEADIEPFKGLLLGLFFISVGSQIDFNLLAQNPGTLTAAVLGTVALKLGVLYALARAFGLDRPARWLVAFSLAQVGEFAFVLASTGQSLRLFSPAHTGMLVATVALSMLLTPLLLIALDRWLLPRLSPTTPVRPHDAIAHAEAPVVIAGFGRFGQIVGRMLRSTGIQATVLDLDPNMVDLLRRLGFAVHYGDASRLDLLIAAGCARAKVFVLATDEPDTSVAIAATVREHFPHLTLLARARNRAHYYRLRQLGVTHVYRETFGTAWELGSDLYQLLGMRAHTALRTARRWRHHDEAALEQLVDLWGKDQDALFAAARRAQEDTERVMREEISGTAIERDHAWDNEELRAPVHERRG
jgi:monovalent cation:proton antiporter-2 (CPA2) family protein